MRQIGRNGVCVASTDDSSFIAERQFHCAFEHDPKLLVRMLVPWHFSIRLDRDPVRHQFATGDGLHGETLERGERWQLSPRQPPRFECHRFNPIFSQTLLILYMVPVDAHCLPSRFEVRSPRPRGYLAAGLRLRSMAMLVVSWKQPQTLWSVR